MKAAGTVSYVIFLFIDKTGSSVSSGSHILRLIRIQFLWDVSGSSMGFKTPERYSARNTILGQDAGSYKTRTRPPQHSFGMSGLMKRFLQDAEVKAGAKDLHDSKMFHVTHPSNPSFLTSN